jgi:hypothetical protein
MVRESDMGNLDDLLDLLGCQLGAPLHRKLGRTAKAGQTQPSFDLEHTFRFLKQSMGWITPRVRHPEQADRWTWLVVAAYTQLRLVHARVANLRLPWERRYDRGRLTPVRVHRVVSSLLMELGTPASAPKPCGRSPGRPKGRLSGRAKRYPAIKTAA